MYFSQLLTLILTSQLTGAEPARETYLDLIQKSQNLMLQKDRLQATRILIRGLERESTKKAKESLITTLQNLSELFFTDKGQQLFEMGQSLRATALPSAIEKFRESWALELGNTDVGRALSRALLQAGNCDEAADIADKALSFNPYAEDLVLTMAQSLVCANKTADGRILLKRLDDKKGTFRIYIETLRAQAAIFEGKSELAEEFLKKAQDMDKEFPEIFYWRAQAQQKLHIPSKAASEKYVELCRKLAGQKNNKYNLEPRICSEKESMQRQLAEGPSDESKSGAQK